LERCLHPAGYGHRRVLPIPDQEGLLRQTPPEIRFGAAHAH